MFKPAKLLSIELSIELLLLMIILFPEMFIEPPVPLYFVDAEIVDFSEILIRSPRIFNSPPVPNH